MCPKKVGLYHNFSLTGPAHRASGSQILKIHLININPKAALDWMVGDRITTQRTPKVLQLVVALPQLLT